MKKIKGKAKKRNKRNQRKGNKVGYIQAQKMDIKGKKEKNKVLKENEKIHKGT